MPIGHNSKVKAGPVNADRLKAFIERIEKLEEERKSIGGDIKDVYAEAKGVGYDIKTMRKVVSLRAMDPADRAEQETLLEVYWHALQTPDRIDARLAAGESQRAIAEAEGVSKSTVQRRGPKVAAASEPSKMDHHDSDGVVTEAQEKADEDGDSGRPEAAGGNGGLPDGGSVPVLSRDAYGGRPDAPAAKGDDRAKAGATPSQPEGTPCAPVSVGAVGPSSARVASPFMGDDPGPPPSFLRGRAA